MSFHEGATATNHETGEKAIFQGGRWRSLGRPPVGATLRTDYGRGAFQTQEGDIAQPGVHGQTVILRKSTRDDGKRIEEAQTNAHNLAIASQAAADFMGRYGKLKFGTGLQYRIPYAEQLAANTVDPELAAMASINSRVAPQLRPVGTGRLQQQELQRFYDSLPSVGDSKAANSAKAAQLQAEAIRAAHYAAHLSSYHAAHGNLDRADEEWDAAPSQAQPAWPAPAGVSTASTQPPRAMPEGGSVAHYTFNPNTGALEPAR